MKYEFCPVCGTHYNLPQNTPNLECSSCGHIFYQNSKPTASVLILDENNNVLLGKRSREPGKGKWDIVGGFLELGEHPEAGAIREAKEETGLEIKIEALVGIFMDTYSVGNQATLNICYTAKVVGGQPQANDDIEELKWFSVAGLPEEMAFANNLEMLAAWKKGLLTK